MSRKNLEERLVDYNKELEALNTEHRFRLASEAIIHEGLIKTKVVVVDVPVKKDGNGK